MTATGKVGLSADRGLELPSEILVTMILPFLDRGSYNRLARTCHDFNHLLLKSPVHLPPWPSRLISNDYMGQLKSFAFSPSGTVIAGGYSDGSVRLWQIFSGEQKPLNGHCPRELVHSIVFGRRTTDHLLLATASTDHTIILWNLEARSGTPISSKNRVEGIHCPQDPQKIHSANVTCLRFSPDDTMLLSAHSSSETINIWSVATRTLIKTLSGPLSRVATMELSKNGTYVVSTAYGDDHTSNCIRVWNLEDSTYESQCGGFHNVVAEASSSSQDEDGDASFLIASVYQPDSFHVWSTSSASETKKRRWRDIPPPPHGQEEPRRTTPLHERRRRRFANAYPHELAFSMDGGSKVASVDDYRSIKIWRTHHDTHGNNLLSTIHEPDAVALYAMSWCPTARVIGAIARTRVGAISRNQNSIRLFQVPSDDDA